MSTTTDHIINHLEFLGYETEVHDDGSITAGHKTHFNFIFREFEYGILFSAFFEISSLGKSERGTVMERVNAFNTVARVCRGYLDKDSDLITEAVFPDLYEKAAFAIFIETLNNDFFLIGNENVKLLDYLAN